MRQILLAPVLVLASSVMPVPPTIASLPGGVVTLYALDPLGNGMSLATGESSYVIQDNECRVRDGDLVFHVYFPDEFAVGYQGGRIGGIIDLGSAEELEARFGLPDRVGHPQGFCSLRILNGELVVGQSPQGMVPLDLFEGTLDDHLPVALGDVYVARVTDAKDPTYDRVVKLIVLAHEPGVSVTFRWQRLE